MRTIACDDCGFFFFGRVRHQKFEQETVELCLRQGVDALVLDRVLCCHHHEAIRQGMRFAIQRHTPFLHRFEQRGLRLWRGAVDFIS